MPEPNDFSDAITVLPPWEPAALPVEPATPRRKGQALIAWIVIVLCCAFVIWTHYYASHRPAELRDEGSVSTLFEFQARYLVGAGGLFGSTKAFYAQAQGLNTGPMDQRLRFIVLAGEMSGPDEALKQIHDLTSRMKVHDVKLTGQQEQVLRILDRLYQDYSQKKFSAPGVSSKDRALLREQLGWYGELALTPADGSDKEARERVLAPAHRTAVLVLGGFVVGSLVGLAGLVALVLLLVFLFSGRLKHGVHCGSNHGGVYAETFALWMVLFLAINYGGGWVVTRLLPVGQWRYLIAGILELFSLAALFWPVLRGVPWGQVRWEVGLKTGRKPLLEPALGLAGNAMSIPLLGVGLLLTMFLMFLQTQLQPIGDPRDNFSVPDLPSHPIIHDVATGGWLERLQLLCLASIVAPVVEETMFRGVLYRHLREASCPLRFAASVLLSILVVSFLFAAIHPQGLVAIPPLMALAVAFNLIREWRGTLVPGMVAHGVHNGLLMLLSFTVFSN